MAARINAAEEDLGADTTSMQWVARGDAHPGRTGPIVRMRWPPPPSFFRCYGVAIVPLPRAPARAGRPSLVGLGVGVGGLEFVTGRHHREAAAPAVPVKDSLRA